MRIHQFEHRFAGGAVPAAFWWLPPAFLLSLYVIGEKLGVWRISDAEEVNLYSLFAQFTAVVKDLNAPAALDLHPFCRFNSERRNLFPVFSMLNAVVLNRAVCRRRQESAKGAPHRSVSCLKFRKSDDFISNFSHEAHTNESLRLDSYDT